MKLVTWLHEKPVVATWILWNHLRIWL